MALSEVATKNAMATHWASLGNQYRLHSAHPGTAANANGAELSGGGYARQNTTWGTANEGTIAGSQVVFPVGAVTATHASRWSSDGTTRRDVIDIADVAITPSGEIRLTPNYTQS